MNIVENDASSVRPEGFCEVRKVYWWKHNEKTPKETSAMTQRALHIAVKTDNHRSFDDYDIITDSTVCVPEIINMS